MKLKLHPYQLRLKHQFNIAHDSRSVQQTLIIEIEHEGMSGFGEATVSKYYHNGLQDMIAVLEENIDLIESYNFTDPMKFWEKLKLVFGENTFALAAVDEALHDLYAKNKQVKLYELWDLPLIKNWPQSNYTIGIDSVQNMITKLREFPWPIYKIKLGTKDDIKIIQELRKVTAAAFRVDANCGWSVRETIENSKILKELGVEFIEQPLPANDWEGMKQVYQYSDLPVVADESCIHESDIQKCSGHFHGVNIKLMKCGGFTPAIGMIKEARTLGLKTMVGCMTESSVGISAVAQLRPFLDYIDMDGFLLIDNDVAEGPYIENQKIIMPERYGVGIDRLVR